MKTIRISEEVKHITENQISVFSKDVKYNEFKEYFEEMKSKGLVNPNNYTIPPLDTVGKRLFQSK